MQTAVQYYQNHFFLATSQICPLEHLNFLPPHILTLKQPPPSRKKSNTIFVKEVLLSFSRADKLPSLRLSKTKYNLAAVRLEKFQSEGQELGKTESYKTEVQNGNFCASQSCRNHWLPAAANSSWHGTVPRPNPPVNSTRMEGSSLSLTPLLTKGQGRAYS